MHYLYILFSENLQKFYVGETNNIQSRVLKHNNHTYKKAFTRASDDWKIVLSKELENRTQTLFLESFIKRMKSKIFINKIIKNPLILDDLLKKM